MTQPKYDNWTIEAKERGCGGKKMVEINIEKEFLPDTNCQVNKH